MRSLLHHLAGNVHSVHDEHVVTLQYDIAIQSDRSESIPAVERQNMLYARLARGNTRQRNFVAPGLFRNPLALELIEAKEWI